MPSWKRNLVILSFAQFLVMSAMSLVMPFLPLFLHEDLGVADDRALNLWAGFIFGANFLTAFIFAPIWGNLADKFGRKIMILRSGFGMALVTGLMGLVTSPVHLLLLRLLNGVISGFIPASIALMSTNTPKERVGFALGTLNSGAVAGSILGPFFGGVMAEMFGFRMIFILTGILLFSSTLMVLFLVKEENKPDPRQQTRGSLIKDFKQIMEVKPLRVLIGAGFLIQFALLSTIPFLSVFVKELMHNSGHVALFAGLAMSITGFANMLFSPILGRWGDRAGSHRVLVYSMLGAALFSIPHIFVVTTWQLLAVRFLLGMCLGGLLPSINSLVRHFAPDGMESRAYGYSSSGVFLGNMMGPIVGGLLSGWFGLRVIFLFSAALFIVNFLLVMKAMNDDSWNKLGKQHLQVHSKT
ncbi:MAG: MFS transporter [Bacillaceae bacterium]|nr:MFS transporter [Bacillaceae bacterium]